MFFFCVCCWAVFLFLIFFSHHVDLGCPNNVEVVRGGFLIYLHTGASNQENRRRRRRSNCRIITGRWTLVDRSSVGPSFAFQQSHVQIETTHKRHTNSHHITSDHILVIKISVCLPTHSKAVKSTPTHHRFLCCLLTFYDFNSFLACSLVCVPVKFGAKSWRVF